ncbi:MAG: cadherin-like domain-containing protein [Acidobacteriota bacterium]|nr:cadherin-like domain-containing protein [Blastocatellia bacterium]MDW8241220.1 cadherin-like domain-containing protein [Acidobacteriota bacterium]
MIINVLANDSDPDRGTLMVTGVSDPPNRTVVNNGNGTVTYTPDANFSGSDSFTYTISDGQGGTDTATVTVNPVNDPPNAVNDGAITDENVPVTINVLANDTDPENDPLTVTGFTAAAHGTVTNLGGGLLKYTPNTNFSGTDSFSYTIGDGQGGTDTAVVATLVNDLLFLQDDRNGHCVAVNLGTHRYRWKTPGGATFTGPVVITLTETTITFRSGPGDANFISGGADIFRHMGSARLQAPRSTGPIFIINDSFTKDSDCP